VTPNPAGAERIPATIVTGFLGAGKTTLIRNLIAQAKGRRIAIIVNEFGDMGFDGGLIGECDDDCRPDEIVELTNGCICCTVADEFLPPSRRCWRARRRPTTSSSRRPAWRCRSRWCAPSPGRR
jgi:G3E family GTPase